MSISEGAMQPESFERREKGTMRTDERRRRTEFPKNIRRERKNPLSLQKKKCSHNIPECSVSDSFPSHSLTPQVLSGFSFSIPHSPACLMPDSVLCRTNSHSSSSLSLSPSPFFSFLVVGRVVLLLLFKKRAECSNERRPNAPK